MRQAETALPYFVLAVSIASCFGATFFCCIFSDILHLVTAHLRFADMLVALVYRWEMSSLYSLWNLFRGEISLWNPANAQCSGRVHRQANDGTLYVTEWIHTITSWTSFSWAPFSSRSRSFFCRLFRHTTSSVQWYA